MRVYIQYDIYNMPFTKNFAYAYYGFRDMGFEIIPYRHIEELKENKKEDIVVGGVDEVRYVLNRFHIEIPEIDYPHEIRHYLGRKIWKSSLSIVNSDPNLWPVFIKPMESKLFTGAVVKSTYDLMGFGENPNAPIYCSEIVNFISEWRVFVKYGKILAVKHYKGDWKIHYDAKIIQNCLEEYSSQPTGFTMDFGVTDDGRTLLIEVNDGYSIGCYGLDPLDYAKLLSARWAELTNTEDQCDFLNGKR